MQQSLEDFAIGIDEYAKLLPTGSADVFDGFVQALFSTLRLISACRWLPPFFLSRLRCGRSKAAAKADPSDARSCFVI